MTGPDLRPLSLGEILDRTFSLYRNNFILFIGIAGIPHILILAVSVLQLYFYGNDNPFLPGGHPVTFFVVMAVALLIMIPTGLLASGGTVIAVSEVYLGRPVLISDALRRAWNKFGSLLGLTILSSLALLGSALLLIIPAFYVGCRLAVSTPGIVIEGKGPRQAMKRSWQLTSDFTGRAFMILLLYFALSLAATALFSAPFTYGAIVNLKDPAASQVWKVMNQISTSIGNVLIEPILLIGLSIFYFDLRVRKEAFDLQLMLDPAGTPPPAIDAEPSPL